MGGSTVRGAALGVIAMAFGCGATPDSQTHDFSMLVSAYADQAYASYSAALISSEAFALAVDELIAEPSAARLEAARTVWLATREPSGGLAVLLSCPAAMTPWRARVHAWPIDERVIDYVEGAPASGIINDVAGVPIVDAPTLLALHQRGAPEHVTVGEHAIEFVLWGQDLDPAGPGARPHGDFRIGPTATARNAMRRGAYLRAATAQWLADLRLMRESWRPSIANMRAEFEAEPPVALACVLRGAHAFVRGELLDRSLRAAYLTQDQQHEPARFSDATLRELAANAAGLATIMRGQGATAPSVMRYLMAHGAQQVAAQLDAAMVATEQALFAIPAPFDRAIVEPAARPYVKAAIDALEAEAAVLTDVALTLGVTENAP